MSGDAIGLWVEFFDMGRVCWVFQFFKFKFLKYQNYPQIYFKMFIKLVHLFYLKKYYTKLYVYYSYYTNLVYVNQ